MKKERSFPHVKVTKKQERTLKDGHPWVYADEIIEAPENVENGRLVDILSEKGQYLGTGLWSENSKIRIRRLDTNANEQFERTFFERRVHYAVEYRRNVMGEDFGACRLIHGEADGLPGLTVDRYEDLLVSEVSSYGMDLRKEWIYEALVKELESSGEVVRGLYERNDGDLRKKEGLEQYCGWYALQGKELPESPIVWICENGVYYEVDVANGQKTGFFLDQKYNRLAVRRMAKGKKILECCTHTGSFALNAAMGGAKEVLAMDISETALANARVNCERNHLEEIVTFEQGDIFEFLPKMIAEHRRFDLVILDPPAFTKSRKTFHNAYGGYKKINAQAMKLLGRGGYLATCSCSHFMATEDFRKMLQEAGKEAGVSVRIVEERHASYDHPVLLGVPETDYLKYFLVQIV